MAYLLKFGTYTLPSTFYLDQAPYAGSTPVSKLPRLDGGVALNRTLGPKKFRLKGGFIPNQAGCGSDLRAAVDTFLQNIYAGPANFQLDDDRYVRQAQLDGEPIIVYGPTGYQRFCTISFDLVTPDPFFYAVTATSQTWTSPATGTTLTVNNASGTAYALPSYTINISASANVNITLANNTTSETFTFSGTPAASQTQIIVNSQLQTVTLGNGNDTILLWDGVFPRLNTGNNTFAFTTNAGNTATVSSIVFNYNSRWN